MQMSDGLARIIRSALQLVAGGGLATLFLQIAEDVNDKYDPYIYLASTGVVVVAQMLIEGWTGSGFLRNASPDIQKPIEPI